MDKADLMLKTFKSTFYSDLTGYYGRTMNNGKIDFTPDSSVLSLINLDVLPPDDPTIKSTVNNIVSRLWVPDTGGLARYEKDFYQRRDNRYDIPGNPWIITTLWLADYYIKIKNFDKARDLISWVVNHSEASGILSEQIDPITGQPLSVSPLTWSHAQFVITLINYKNAINQK